MRRPILATFACWAALELGGCGRGLYTSDPQGMRHDGDNAFDSTVVPGDAGDERTFIDGAESDDGGSFARVVFKSGASGPVDLGEARVTVRSGTFSEDVTITLRAIPSPRTGPVGFVYQVDQTPLGAHARIALHFDLHLSAEENAAAAQYKLASYKAKTPPPGLWLAMAGQTLSATEQAMGADINNLDQESLVVALLRKCAVVEDCGAFGGCFSGLCQ